MILRSYVGEAAVIEFSPSQIPSVQGVRAVPRSNVEKLSFARTVCTWSGEPFLIVGVDGQVLHVFYIGSRGEWMSQQPAMVRTGKLETHGRLALSDVKDILEFVDPLPL